AIEPAPNPDRGRLADTATVTGRQPAAVRAEREAADRARVASEHKRGRAAVCVNKSNRMVVRGGGEQFPVGTEGDRAGCTRNGKNRPAGGGIQHLNRFRARGGDALAVRTEAHTANRPDLRLDGGRLVVTEPLQIVPFETAEILVVSGPHPVLGEQFVGTGDV